MSSVILTNWTVYYADDAGAGAGMKQIKWTGTTGTNTLNELYSALMNLFDNPSQNDADDSIPIKAVTPTLYEIGSFDSGDKEPWFIDPESIKHLTGGGLNTVKWKRDPLPGDGTGDIGIVKITRSGTTNIVAGDIGATITNSTGGDDGWLLHIEGNTLWIRPDTNGTADDWDTTGGSGDLVCNGHTDTQATAGVTGESVWSNIFTLGSIESNTTLYVSQSNSVISNTEASGSGRWWGDGHLDALFLTTDQGTLVDRGLLTFFARQYSKKYGFFTTNASAGGRIPVPLSTSDDLNNTSGYRTFTGSSGTGSFNEGNAVYVGGSWATATAKGILTADASGTTPTITYYLIHDLTELSGTIYEYDFLTDPRTTSTVVGTPTNTGPATALTITFGLNTTFDINDDTTNEDYSIVIDLTDSITLAQMYERLKYKTRRGETTNDLDGIDGEQYIGIDYRVDYLALTSTISDGATVTQVLADGTTATSEVVAHNTTGGSITGYLMLRDTRGTLEVGTGAANLEVDGSNYVTMTGAATATVIAPIQETPFGSLAGGRFFGARGVVLDNVPAADSQNYELVDNAGTRIVPPVTIPLTIQALVAGDRVTMFRATGDNNTVDKTIFTSHASSNTDGNGTFIVQETISAANNDTPTAGAIRTVHNSGTGLEQRYRYASWSVSTFTLVTGASGTATTSNTEGTQLIDSAADFGGADDVERGDVLRNSTDGSSARITEVVNTTTLNHTKLSGGTDNQWDSVAPDSYTTNLLDRAYNGSDTAYVPFIDKEATSTSVSVSVTYDSDRFVTTRVRKLGIIPFTVKGSIDSTGLTVTAIRQTDSIVDLPG